MGKNSKLREKILSGDADGNIRFIELCRLLMQLGFDRRIKGDHHIFTRDDEMEHKFTACSQQGKAVSGQTSKRYNSKIQVRGFQCGLSMN